MKDSATYRVFVYGTLMKGGRNDQYLKGYRCVGTEAVTKEAQYYMLQFNSSSGGGKFSPGVLKRGQGHIKGEIYEVDVDGLKELDRLEQNGTRYQREKIEMQDGTRAWMYILIAKDKEADIQDRIEVWPRENIYEWRRQEPAPV